MEHYIRAFLDHPIRACEPVDKEQALQCELATFLRKNRARAQFEKKMIAPFLPGSTVKPKQYLDLFVQRNRVKVGIELKLPLNGKHPETMYDFCTDIAFVESLVRTGQIDKGYCLLMTPDPLFWRDTGRPNAMLDLFRKQHKQVTGVIQKPTGKKDTCVVLSGTYEPFARWADLGNTRLMQKGRYLLLDVSL